MNIVQATHNYETWLRHRTTLVQVDIKQKHQLMAASPFPFLRATFYRWLQIWAKVCPEVSVAPRVLAVGDLHIENFGTWRDNDGRLAWGINDFDEVSHMPYTIDLVRLAASALLARECDHFAIKPRKIAAQILAGYTDAIATGGRPFVLSEGHGWLRKIALTSIREGAYFWAALSRLKLLDKHQVPVAARAAMERVMPEKGLSYGYARRSAGLGSRGHLRFVAVVDWRGGQIAREAKALVPAASVWLRGKQGGGPILYSNILRRAVRVPDPCFGIDGKWVVRRLSPSCRKISVAGLPSKYEKKLLYSMGWETANVHLGTPRATTLVSEDLKGRKGDWLFEAGRSMVKAVRRDWKFWRGQ